MQLADIIAALETARRLPREALAEAVAQADALAPHVLRCMEHAASGRVLLPRQETFLFYGLHALAAARHTPGFVPLLALLHADPMILDRLFGDSLTETMSGIVISLYDGNQAALLDAIADPALDGRERWSLLKALAWLTWQERIPSATTLPFLHRLDTEQATPPEDEFWLGWCDAMTLLGQTAFEDRILARAESAEPDIRAIDLDDIRDRLADAAARPEDGHRFAQDFIAPIDDPAATLHWIPADPPLIQGALDPAALSWFAFFLDSDEAPSRAMTTEELDGFMAALAVLPAAVPPETYVPLIWGEPEPPIEGKEKQDLIADILARHPGHTARELAASQPFHARLRGFSYFDPDDMRFGIDWANGFLRGTELNRPAWDRLLAHPVHAAAADALARLAEGRPDPAAAQSRSVRLRKTARLLGDVARTAYRFFRNLPIAAPAASLRATKIGRNDPCLCGSGKKYKKCCGAAA